MCSGKNGGNTGATGGNGGNTGATGGNGGNTGATGGNGGNTGGNHGGHHNYTMTTPMSASNEGKKGPTLLVSLKILCHSQRL